MVNRASLMSIYSGLSNDEKNLWGINAGYTGYSSLYRYLYRDPDNSVKPSILNALKQTVGEVRYNQLIAPLTPAALISNASESANTLINLIAEIRSVAITEISSCNDTNTLEELRRVLGIASDITTNKLNTLTLYDNLR